MKLSSRSIASSLTLLIAGIGLLLPAVASANQTPPASPPLDAGGDDLFLLQASIAPNVILVMDNSTQMKHIEWHPAFDPDKVPDSTYCTSASWSDTLGLESTDWDFTAATGRLVDGSGGGVLTAANIQVGDVVELGPEFTNNAGSYVVAARIDDNTIDLTGVFTTDDLDIIAKITRTTAVSESLLPGDVHRINGPSSPSASCDSPVRASRTLYTEKKYSLWDGRYLMWYLGLDETDSTDAAILNEIDTGTANVEGCTEKSGAKVFNHKYRRTRFEASKQVLMDLLCLAEPKNVRFGQGEFRVAADALLEDPTGGFITSDLGRANPNHAAELESAIKNSNVALEPTLSETLFQLYTYWMSRDLADIPVGIDGVTQFPRYQYDKSGDWDMNPNSWFDDPILYSCEKAFFVIVSTGLPARDDFDEDPPGNAVGFSDFSKLIGNYHADAEIEDPMTADEPTYYLDDIAKYMYEKDFRPDFGGSQTIDTYTISFATGATTEAFMERVAVLGNGKAYTAADGDELAVALIAALNDIIEKSASFTSATVPSARTADGADFYQAFFFPRSKDAFWEGHIRAWKIDADGAVRQAVPAPPATGLCALDDPDPGECNSGPFVPSAVYFWDTAEEVPAPASRNLYVSDTGVTSGSLPPAFTQANISAADLFVDPFTAAPDHAPNSPLYAVNGSTATTEEGLADEIVAATRGCFFGTGVSTNVATPVPCAARPGRIGDIFHSNPVVVRRPLRRTTDPSFEAYKTHYSARKRVLYAGTNAGFLEAFHAGSWVVPSPPALPHYDEGTGVELFGFMPWEARQKIKKFPIDAATSRNHYVDGDANASDVWIHPTPSTATKAANGSEWRSYLVGGLREGGHHYYALDVTNPNGITPAGGGGALPYPGYAWEFPDETDTAGDGAFMGETWARPIITKIRLKDPLDSSKLVERWVAIVTAGYDPTSDPNPDNVNGVVSSYDASSTLGRGVYIIDLKTGGVIAEKKFGSLVDNQASMLFSTVGSASVLDLNFDGFADTIYIVSMGGQVYKWSIAKPGEDRINDSSGLRTQPSWPFKLFFQAAPATIGANTYYKNFMFAPAAAYKSGKLFLAFGSGERRSLPFAGDPDASETDENNRFYVMVDSDPYERASPALATITESDLTDFSGSDSAATFTNKGFFFEVADGEKFVTNVEIFGGEVIAASFKPTTSLIPCSFNGGGTLYVFDVATGEGHFEDGSNNPDRSLSLGSGLPTDPKVSIGVGGKKNKVVIEKSGSDIEIIDQDDVPLNGATLYWKEAY